MQTGRNIILALVAFFAIAAATPLAAADQRNVTVINKTGYPIKFMGFNSPDDDEWSDNELGGIFADGDRIYVKFNEADRGCVWNIRVDWAEEDSGVLWRDVDLCRINSLTLRYDRQTEQTSFTAD